MNQGPAPWRLPQKQFVERKCNVSVRSAYLDAGIPAAIADFLSRRLDRFLSWESLVAPKLSDIADPGLIPSMDRAVERIVHREHCMRFR